MEAERGVQKIDANVQVIRMKCRREETKNNQGSALFVLCEPLGGADLYHQDAHIRGNIQCPFSCTNWSPVTNMHGAVSSVEREHRLSLSGFRA